MELNNSVLRILKTGMWYLSTNGDEPNIAPVGFKETTSDGKLIVGVLHLNNTLSNIQKNNTITVSVCNGKVKTGEGIKCHAKFISDGSYMVYGYHITGTAKFVEEGPYVDKWKSVAKKVLKGTIPVIGVLEITPQTIENAFPDLIS